MLTAIAVIQFIATMGLATTQVIFKLLFPDSAPEGVTTIMLLIMVFGSTTLLAVSLIGEYIAKIFDEVKQRPHFIRNRIIRDGRFHDADDTGESGN